MKILAKGRKTEEGSRSCWIKSQLPKPIAAKKRTMILLIGFSSLCKQMLEPSASGAVVIRIGAVVVAGSVVLQVAGKLFDVLAYYPFPGPRAGFWGVSARGCSGFEEMFSQHTDRSNQPVSCRIQASSAICFQSLLFRLHC